MRRMRELRGAPTQEQLLPDKTIAAPPLQLRIFTAAEFYDSFTGMNHCE